MVPVLKANHRPPETLASSLSLLKPQDHQLAIQVLGSPARDIGQVELAGGHRITHTIAGFLPTPGHPDAVAFVSYFSFDVGHLVYCYPKASSLAQGTGTP